MTAWGGSKAEAGIVYSTMTITGRFSNAQPPYAQTYSTLTITGQFSGAQRSYAQTYSTLTITGQFSGAQTSYAQTYSTLTITGQFAGAQPSYAQVYSTLTITGQFAGAQPSYAQVYSTLTITGQFAGAQTSYAHIYSTLTITGQFSSGQGAFAQIYSTMTITGQFAAVQSPVAQIYSTMTITGQFSATQATYAQSYATFTITCAFGSGAPVPATPVWLSPAGTATSPAGYTLNMKPKLWFSCTDATPTDTFTDWLVTVADDSNFSINVATFQFSVSGGGWTPSLAPATNGTTFYFTPQVNMTATTHWVKAMVANASGWSAPAVLEFQIQSPSWTDPAITAGSSIVRAPYFNELRTAVGNVRLFRGLAAPSWAQAIVAGQTIVTAAIVNELRTNLDDALFAVGLSSGPATWTDGTLVARSSRIRAAYLTELRSKAAQP